MAIGFGPGSELQKTVNRQRANSTKRSLKESSESTSAGTNKNQSLKFKEASPEVLEKIREDMKVARKKKQIGNLIFTVVLITIVIYIIMQPIF